MKCVSLFSGCGGLDWGLKEAGFQTVLGLDNDAIAASSFALNFPATPFIQASIGAVDRNTLLQRIGKNAYDIDLLAGGPPCPPFSKSRFYRKEKPRALDDPNGWETINGFLNAVEWLNPRAFLLENVKGLTYKTHSEALETIMARAKVLGYHVAYATLNAADFGVPQIRERCFVVGLRDTSPRFPHPTHSGKTELGVAPWVTAGDVLNDIDTDDAACDKGHFAGGQYNHLLKEVPPGSNYLHFTAERGHPRPIFKWRSRYWSFLLKLSPEMPAWTIQARRSNNMGPFHWRNRILRIEEIKRLQTFPDNFQLVGTIEQQWRQIGNAVPPLLAKQMGIAIREQLATKQTQAVA